MIRADPRCLVPSETEWVEDFRVSRWKGVPESPPLTPEKRQGLLRMVVIPIVSIITTLAVSRLIMVRIAVGDFLLGKIFAVAVMVVPFLVIPIIVAYSRRHPKREVLNFPSSIEFPGAVPVRAITDRGTSLGWLSMENDRLTFHGEAFDFALSPDAFLRPERLFDQLTGDGARLRVPQGVSPQRLRLRFKTQIDGEWVAAPEAKERFRAEFEAWLRRPALGESLYPPLRWSGARPRMGLLFLSFGSIGLVLGLAIWQLPVILGTDIFEGRSLLGPGIGVFAFMLMIPFMLSNVASGMTHYDREVEKIQRSERKSVATPSE